VKRLRRASAFLMVALASYCTAPPRPDGFYIAPKRKKAPVSDETQSVRRRRPGDLLRSEPMTPPPMPGTAAWKILYASTGLDGQLIEVSGVVIAPTRQAPIHGRNVVAWAHPTTGVARNCAPSILKGVFETIPHLPALMALDDVVVATDYPGLGTTGPHPYLVGLSEGRAVLDSVRAAQQVEKTGANARFAVWGHSQGGHAALFAGQLAKSYAPDLTLVGVAAIAPATDLEQLLKDDEDERAGKIIVSYCLWSWSRVYATPLEEWVSADVIPAIDRIAGDCVETEGEALGAMFATVPIPANYLSPGVFTNEKWHRLFVENRPGGAPAGAPLYVAQGLDDPVVRPTVTADFVSGLCRAGETVRYETFPGVAHMKAGRVSASSALQWMQSRFDGVRAPNTCPPM
jgi:acetyl esterase/lipase